MKSLQAQSGRDFLLPLLLLSCSPADLAWRITVDFLEHAAEKLVIGKAVLVQNLEHRLIR